MFGIEQSIVTTENIETKSIFTDGQTKVLTRVERKPTCKKDF